jgi:pimeloyl-ACP methyl ester carboxylesterase
LGPTDAVLTGTADLLERVHAEANNTVSIIGWSLGGLYARELARAAPDTVRQVITLGSPIQMLEQDSSSAQGLWNALKHLHSPDFKRETRAAFRPHLKVPATSIYSRTDGVVHWHMSLIRQTEHSENIRVYGSHCGLGFNNSAIFAIADRLAQPEDTWLPFQVPFMLRPYYPRSHSFNLGRLPLSG